jgi:hypothetical protein
MPPGELADSAVPARWRALCERFVEIKLGAFRHDLAPQWRALAQANPDTPGLLAEWESLNEEIAELDDRERVSVTRHWNGDAGDDFGEGEDEAYTCPTGRCDRQISARESVRPRCELFGCAMKVKAKGRPADGGR